MLTTLIMGFLYVLGFGLFFALVWGVPSYFMYREQHVPEQERRLWILVNVFVPWITFLVFMMVAPVRSPNVN